MIIRKNRALRRFWCVAAIALLAGTVCEGARQAADAGDLVKTLRQHIWLLGEQSRSVGLMRLARPSERAPELRFVDGRNEPLNQAQLL